MEDKKIDTIINHIKIYLGEFDNEFRDFVKLKVISVNEHLKENYPNSYDEDKHQLLLIEKVAYELSDKPETQSNTILRIQAELITKENNV